MQKPNFPMKLFKASLTSKLSLPIKNIRQRKRTKNSIRIDQNKKENQNPNLLQANC